MHEMLFGGIYLQDPSTYLHGVANNFLKAEDVGHRHALLLDKKLPICYGFAPVWDRERAEVSNYSRRKKHVAEQVVARVAHRRTLYAQRPLELGPVPAHRLDRPPRLTGSV